MGVKVIRVILIVFAACVLSGNAKCLGQGGLLPTVTVQRPTLGVAVDTNGVLTAKTFPDPTGQLNRLRLQAAKKIVPPNLHQKSSFRKISMRRLDAAIAVRTESGESFTEAMKTLAGLTRIEYVFVLPEQKDIVIAGPAEPWIENLAGRYVGAHSGHPIVLLEDWLVALRLFGNQSSGQPWIACSIDPTVDGLENLKKFQASLPRNIAARMQTSAAQELTTRLRKSLGDADVRVYGIDPRTNAARVMVEADFRMKAIAIGLETAPLPIRTFIQALKGAPRHFQRWWLTPEYQCLVESQDDLGVQLVGQGVQLRTETITFDKQAMIQRVNQKPSRAARTYANSFTEHYEKLARAKPVFAQLRNIIDSFVLAAWLNHRKAYDSIDWRPETLLSSKKLSLSHHPTIKKAQSLANGIWKNNVLLMPSGGVSISPGDALLATHIRTDNTGAIAALKTEIKPVGEGIWWWD